MMGLDIGVYTPKYSFRAGSYTGFHEWRHWLAKKEGINLDAMFGFGGLIEWDTIKSPLVPLLNHSDCDGQLWWSECVDMLPRMREIMESCTEEDDWFADILAQWVQAMETVDEHGGVLVFM